MANKKESVALSRLKKLHQIGVAKDIHARKEPSKQQADKIRREFKKLHAVANAPKGEYVRKDISKFTPRDIKYMKESGIVIDHDTAYLPKHGYGNVNLTETYKRGSDGIKRRTVQIERKIKLPNGKFKTETERIGSNLSKMAWRDRLMEEYLAGNFGPNDYIGLKAFDGSMFNRVIVTDMKQIFGYASDRMMFNGKPDLVRDNLHVVKIHVGDLSDMDLDLRSEKQKEARRYQIRKSSKATQTKKLKGRASLS